MNPLSNVRESLPIFKDRQRILEMIDRNIVSIIQAETGSGKSTQIPQFLIESNQSARIAISQPRRMPAIAVASRVASEMNTTLGSLVGYHIKGEFRGNTKTQITYMTCGILIQIISHVGIDDEMPWDYIIMDEVHERSIEMDFLLVIFKYFLAKGKIFKLILMSATMQPILADYFSINSISRLRQKHFSLKGEDDEFFIDWTEEENSEWKSNERGNKESKGSVKDILKGSDSLDVFSADSRKYPIKILYLKDFIEFANHPVVVQYLQSREKEANFFGLQELESIFKNQRGENPEEIENIFFNLAARLILYHLLQYPDVKNDTFLVFLPGIQEINQMNETLQNLLTDDFDKLDIIMLHSSIPENEHKKVLKPPKNLAKRVVLSTNIAESSITLPDVSYVIDFCCSREIFFSQRTMTESLVLVWAAKAALKQRAGRSGRVSNGTVFRVLSLSFFSELKEYPIPEMQRTCLDKIILKLKLMNFSDPKKILSETIQPPSNEQVQASEDFLREMGAIDQSGKISRLGRIYVDMPFDIKVTRLCVFGIMFHCVPGAILCASVLASEKQPIVNLSNLRPAESIKHPETYKKRLIYAKDSNSDLIMLMNVYKEWFKRFGKEVEADMFRNGHRHARAKRPSLNEKNFCNEQLMQTGALREILGNYLEMKKRLLEFGVDPLYFREESGENVLKLCISAAFCNRVLVSQYEILDDRMRNREIDLLGKSTSKVYISKHQSSIDGNDLRQLLSACIQKPIKVEQVTSMMVVDFGPNVHFKTLQMALWLGNYGKRYANLAWVVLKEEKMGRKQLIRPDPTITSRVPGDHRREGSSYIIKDRNRTVEINYIKRLEYPYKLHFRDLITGQSVRIEEDSVNFVLFSTDPELSNSYSIICSEFIERTKNFVGKNATLMPLSDFLPYLIVIIFTPNVRYVKSENEFRYLGFRIPPNSPVEFKCLFTQDDAEKINEIRSRISHFAGNSDYFENSGLSTEVYAGIMELLENKRIKIHSQYPDWTQIIGFKFEETKEAKEFLDIGGFLPQIPLLDLKVDLSRLPQQIDEIRKRKLEYLEELHKMAKIFDVQDAYLVCGECLQIITNISKVRLKTTNPLCFSIDISYGALISVEIPGESELTCLINENFVVQKYEACNSSHIIGWSNNDGIYVSGSANLKILLPKLVYLDFTQEHWENNFSKVHSMKKANLLDLSKLKLDRTCKLCKESFLTDQSFSNHIQLSEKHQETEKEFTQDYIV